MALYVYIRCQLDRHVDSEFHGVTVWLACDFLSANLRIVESQQFQVPIYISCMSRARCKGIPTPFSAPETFGGSAEASCSADAVAVYRLLQWTHPPPWEPPPSDYSRPPGVLEWSWYEDLRVPPPRKAGLIKTNSPLSLSKPFPGT